MPLIKYAGGVQCQIVKYSSEICSANNQFLTFVRVLAINRQQRSENWPLYPAGMTAAENACKSKAVSTLVAAVAISVQSSK
jgi:hypothetical protein